ncbi:Mitochondrial import inner membrane translocase subunit TIM13 [Zalerion maritima]|uniref:Mitochondrial import inner membrane translocase subunit n=1 Tax=Zalerion maritima TaxID=339359 RepID=A0AAD5RZA3_9PEZI|nr:Mitochondrial import inner membrane translocase subunit TIM13 [Zalerion maritima]
MSATGSKELKENLMRQIQQESATQNARLLIDAIQDNCFTKCVSKPGTSLSKAENTCYTQCVDKYMAAWNTVSAALMKRIKEDQGLQ